MKTTGEHIVNMIQTKRGEHCLFRSFGLSATDQVGLISKSDLTTELAKWYPAVTSVTVERVSADDGVAYKITAIEG